MTTGKLFSAIPLSSAVGKETDISSLVRYLTESPWFPTALLPNKHLQWQGIDAYSARAIMHDQGYSASAIFTFNDKGEIITVTTRDKYRTIAGKHNKEPWTAYYGNYKEVHGIKIPTEIEAEWNVQNRKFKYLKLKVTDIQYKGL